VNVGGALEPPPQSYKEALAWLYSLQRFGIKLGLENMHRLIGELTRSGRFPAAVWLNGALESAAPCVIHVAGTNGKGSVCAMIDSISRAQGYRTGLFTSPHLVTFRERIRLNGEMISENAVADGLAKIRDLVADWDQHPTFFEVVTALALQYFANEKIDIVILETGLGGRLDATNAVASDVAVITPIDLDHQNWLGDSIDKIASEKAGIIKAKTPVVSAKQSPEAEQVIRARAAECEAPLQFVTESYDRSPLTLRGSHQKQNAAIAIAALRAGKIEIDDAAIERGLLSVEWPARFQRWDERTIIDGAHNPAAARVLAESWREVFGNHRATLILAILSDKDLPGICQALTPIADYVFLPTIRSERAVDPQALANVMVGFGMNCQIVETFAEALGKARARSAPILITGSLHFAGEALAFLRGTPAAFEECAQ
jgi:dihydrofolate synthase/folylpolyglutamate synthase